MLDFALRNREGTLDCINAAVLDLASFAMFTKHDATDSHAKQEAEAAAAHLKDFWGKTQTLGTPEAVWMAGFKAWREAADIPDFLVQLERLADWDLSSDEGLDELQGACLQVTMKVGLVKRMVVDQIQAKRREHIDPLTNILR